MSNFEGEVMN
jgi:hypothetical protein